MCVCGLKDVDLSEAKRLIRALLLYLGSLTRGHVGELQQQRKTACDSRIRQLGQRQTSRKVTIAEAGRPERTIMRVTTPPRERRILPKNLYMRIML